MASTFDLNLIKKALMAEGFDGWLFYDFQGSDPIGRRILHLRDDEIKSRRWFYLIPANGVPQKLVHSIEKDVLDHLPGKKLVYLSWQELNQQLGKMLEGVQKIAMQYSPKNRIPTLAKVDAGTIELVKSYKKRLYSSADLVQYFEARVDSKELNSHIYVANYLRQLIDHTFAYIKRLMDDKQHLTESDVQRFIYEKLEEKELIFGRLPIVATGINSANPHYAPIDRGSTPLKRDQVIQIEIWAKEKHDYAIYANCCWVGYLGDTVSDNVARIFNVIRQSRDKAVSYIASAMQKNRVIHGWQVDNLVRKTITEAGYGSYFIHRTGHSLGRELYGYGANLDNLESKDERKIIPQTCFSIEPGIYLKEYGMRTQANLYVHENGATIYGEPVQKDVVAILGDSTPDS
jgi:Xaa-Pro aminopeptidase